MKKFIQRRAAAAHRTPERMQSFYDRIHHLYRWVEWHQNSSLHQIVNTLEHQLAPTPNDTALEYACGSGLLTFKIAPLFQTVTARDLSPKMLARAARRNDNNVSNIAFEHSSILDIPDTDNQFDYAFVSFALHLFSPTDQKKILGHLLRVSRKEVVIIDHPPKWQMGIALIEWWEGSYYNEFVNTQWREVAEQLQSTFSREIIAGCQVQRWRLNGSPSRAM